MKGGNSRFTQGSLDPSQPSLLWSQSCQSVCEWGLVRHVIAKIYFNLASFSRRFSRYCFDRDFPTLAAPSLSFSNFKSSTPQLHPPSLPPQQPRLPPTRSHSNINQSSTSAIMVLGKRTRSSTDDAGTNFSLLRDVHDNADI